MDRETRLKRLRYRAWHRGTKEADMLIGGFFDCCAADWGEAEIAWFEALIDEQDVDILAWAMGRAEAPDRFGGAMMERMRLLDYIGAPE